MLHDLKVLNGIISPKYDINNNKYTVKVDSSIDKLELEYDISDDQSIDILGNENLKEGENFVVISIKEFGNVNYILLNVIKETEETVVSLNDNDALEIKDEFPSYVGPLIIVCSILLIAIFFLLLFKRKRC